MGRKMNKKKCHAEFVCNICKKLKWNHVLAKESVDSDKTTYAWHSIDCKNRELPVQPTHTHIHTHFNIRTVPLNYTQR